MTIKEARTKTNRPAEEIAKLLGFPLKTWLAWEEGERKPPQYIVVVFVLLLPMLTMSLVGNREVLLFLQRGDLFLFLLL